MHAAVVDSFDSSQSIDIAISFVSNLQHEGTVRPDCIHPDGLMQHVSAISDGLLGVPLAFHKHEHRVEVLLAYEASPFVVLVCARVTHLSYVGVELVRMEDGRVREHWSGYGCVGMVGIRALRLQLDLLKQIPGPTRNRMPLAKAHYIATAFLTDWVIHRRAHALLHLTPMAYREWHAGSETLIKQTREHEREVNKGWVFNVTRLHAVITDGHLSLGISEGYSGSHMTRHFDLMVIEDSGIVFRLPIDELIPLPISNAQVHGKFGMSSTPCQRD